MKSVAIIIVLSLFPGLIAAQEVSISGTIPGGEQTEVRLMAFADYISYRQEILLRTTTNEYGFFQFSPEIYETRMVTLEIGHYSFSFFIEESGEYGLHCDTIDLVDQLRPLYNKEPLPAFIESEPSPGLNKLIGQFNGAFNEFILSEFGGVYQKRNTNILTNFRSEKLSEYAEYNNPFINQYIAYKLGVVELAMAPSKKPVLFNEYLNDKPIMLFHPEYMDFFNNYFDKHIFPGNKFVKHSDLYATINYNSDYHALMDTLGKDTLLMNEVLRELVCLKTLKELYYSNDFSSTQVIKVIRGFQSNSKFQHHRQIATNLIHQLTHLKKGSYPPEMRLNGMDGNPITLDDLKGKPIYISFFTTWSFGCLTELELMKDLYDNYQGKINFLSISLDSNMEIVNELIEEKDYDWNFAYNGLDYDLLFNFRIKTFPVFLLLDKDGRVIEYPAFKPSEVIHESFDRLLLPK